MGGKRRGPMPAPTKLKIVRGNPGKRALNQREPEPTIGTPGKPEWLKPLAVAEWDRVVPELERLGLLTVVDGPSLAAYCQAFAEFADAQEFLNENGATYVLRDKDGEVKSVQQFPQVAIARNAAHSMRMFASEFGLTPASRSRLSTPAPKEEADPFAKYEGAKK